MSALSLSLNNEQPQPQSWRKTSSPMAPSFTSSLSSVSPKVPSPTLRQPRRPSPLSNNSFGSQDPESAMLSENDETEPNAVASTSSSGPQLVSRSLSSARPPLRRGSGSEVEDELDEDSPKFEGHALDDLASKVDQNKAVLSDLKADSAVSCDKSTNRAEKLSAQTSVAPYRAKPQFPRSAPPRPFTLRLSPLTTTTNGKVSAPHAGSGAKPPQRQKLIVPKKGWKMSFDLGLTQSEFAREQ